jgi:hypothetical protein
VCDGKDNDCNGLTDEGLGTVTCGKGECLHTQPACADGEVQACDPMQGAAIEECDGLDNDCDGLVDEKLGTLSCGLGVCKHTVPACLDGEPQECDPTQGAGMEVCDGLDNDCNGLVDEGIGNVACGKGECLHEQPYCKDGKVTVCDPFKGASQEVCDGLDNDCNGLVDENQWPLTCGQGICLHTVPGCVAGEVPVCDPLDGAAAEECDAKDNDCDGLVDEGLGFTTCGVGVCLHTVANCSEGEPQECDPMQGAGTELCDGKDNDCNGTSDPENAIGCTPYYLDSDADGYGVTGKSKCLCAPLAPYSTPTAEDCNDANPAVSPAAAESCTNLIDDDCDGKVNDGCAYTSCKAALQEVPASPSGLYSLDPDGAGGNEPFLAWCDMTTSGGGWTLVMTAGTTSAYLYGHNVWTDASGGTAAGCDPGLDQDCVSRAFYTLSGTESMLALGSTANWNSWYHKKETPRNLANQPRMAGGYGAAGDCTAQTNCGTEPVNLKPLGIQAACSMSYSTKWHRFGYVNDVNSWGTNTRVGFTGDNDGSDSSDSVMGIGLQCYNACVPNSCTGSPHNSGAGGYLYTSWAAQPLDGAARGWLWIR